MKESSCAIRRLVETDAEAYAALRRVSLLDSPLAYVSAPEDDLARTAEAVRELLRKDDDSALFGAFDRELVGCVGIYRDRHRKAAHKMHIWGMYVAPTHRRRGVAARLLEAAIAHGRSTPGVACVHLSVSSAAAEAKRLYERFGFRTWGTEPDALRHDGRSVSEDHMIFQLWNERCGG